MYVEYMPSLAMNAKRPWLGIPSTWAMNEVYPGYVCRVHAKYRAMNAEYPGYVCRVHAK